MAADSLSNSHYAFVNMLAVGQPTGSTAIRIAAFSYDAGTGNASITWTSSPGKAYALDYTGDLASWPGDADDGIAAAEDAEETTYPFSTSDFGWVHEPTSASARS